MASKEAQKLFDRRRTGLDRKARDLIMKSLSMHNIDLGITIIYEFGEEVSMFRSHLDDGLCSNFWHVRNILTYIANTRKIHAVRVSREWELLMRKLGAFGSGRFTRNERNGLKATFVSLPQGLMQNESYLRTYSVQAKDS
ncbi:hypothetical protein GGP41_009357 [Bipolaris sorokiniana]|uniref:Uncharacterized protein n=1 Tax=Cochliobolus sativus TaxID=45130 RepID=A0A8H6DRR2_COCSA|nr:hypothetical protein GGP41_009357 [Bipolaris sorokiniana]